MSLLNMLTSLTQLLALQSRYRGESKAKAHLCLRSQSLSSSLSTWLCLWGSDGTSSYPSLGHFSAILVRYWPQLTRLNRFHRSDSRIAFAWKWLVLLRRELPRSYCAEGISHHLIWFHSRFLGRLRSWYLYWWWRGWISWGGALT